MGAWKKGELCLDGIRKIAYVLSRVNGINNGNNPFEEPTTQRILVLKNGTTSFNTKITLQLKMSIFCYLKANFEYVLV